MGFKSSGRGGRPTLRLPVRTTNYDALMILSVLTVVNLVSSLRPVAVHSHGEGEHLGAVLRDHQVVRHGRPVRADAHWLRLIRQVFRDPCLAAGGPG